MKRCIYFNPYGLHGLPSHKINPAGMVDWSRPDIVRFAKLLIRNVVPKSHAKDSGYFEANAQRLGEAIALVIAERDGVLTLPELGRMFAALAAGGQPWLDFAYEMHKSSLEFCRMVEAEIHEARGDSSGGFKGIVGELARAFACLTDPYVSRSLSPPFDFDMAELCDPENPVNLYVMVPEDQVDTQAVIIKSIFVRTVIEKAQRPSAGKVLALIDEMSQLAGTGFDLAAKLYSIYAGIGVQTVGVVQNHQQLAGLAAGAERIIPSSAGLNIQFGIREPDSAQRLSTMIGSETLRHSDDLTQARASEEEWQLGQALLSGADPFTALPKLRLKSYERRHSVKIKRPVLTPDEVLRLPREKMVVFADGLPGAMLVDGPSYWTVPEMAGRYHPNPYHPPMDQVRVATKSGERWRPVIREPVPQQFAHLPQYADGTWSRIGEEEVK